MPALYGQVRLADLPGPSRQHRHARSGRHAPTSCSPSATSTIGRWAISATAGSLIREEAFRQMFAMLRPGGTLGVVDHRLPESADAERERTSGYIKVSTVRRLAEAAGFRFVGASEVNANPRDTADWPNGVWTLPPALRHGDVDRARYLRDRRERPDDAALRAAAHERSARRACRASPGARRARRAAHRDRPCLAAPAAACASAGAADRGSRSRRR